MPDDESLLGLTPAIVSALRYVHHAFEPDEVEGLVCRRIPRGARVLDVGCGTGSLAQMIATRRDATVVGIEPNGDRVSAARSCGLTVHHGFYDHDTASKLGRFDVILFADVLEHMSSPGEVLEVARQWLTPGGVVIASIPNAAHWTLRWSLLLGKFDYEPTGLMDATHLRWFTAASAFRLFRAAGFDSVQLDWTSGAHLKSYSRVPLFVMRTSGLRKRAVRRMVRVWPTFFGFQHIITATSRRSTIEPPMQRPKDAIAP